MLFSKMKKKIKQFGLIFFVRDILNVFTINKNDFNWRCRTLKKDIADYEMLKKKFGKIVYQTDWTLKTNKPIPKKIWICWLQGEEDAPEIIKICMESVRRVFNDYDVIVVTDDNIHEFIKIPHHISKKRENGEITPTHFSDWIRLELLIKYGGVWLDSTVLATSKNLIETITDANNGLFIFQDFKSIDSSVGVSSWCIAANQNNPYLITVRNLLNSYWLQNNYMCNYFLFHLFFMIVAELRSEEWNKIPVFSSQPPHILQYELFNKYSESRFDQIIKMSDLHKLSYKFKDELFLSRDTFYQHIKANFLEEEA